MDQWTLIENEELDERYYRIRHRSGLTVCVFPKKMSTAYAAFATKYGSMDNCFRLSGDTEFTRVPDGVAHFLEHKMFENENGEDAFVQFSETGASANAFTSNTETCYLFSTTDQFEKSLEILLNFVTHPYFSEETVKKEQGIIGQEITMYLDNPSACLYHELLNAMYRDNKVRIRVEGSRESIAQITPEILYRCHSVFYRPSNMVLSVCGDVTCEEVLSVCDRVLTEEDDGRTIEVDPEDKDEPKEVYKRRAETFLPVAKPIFAIGVKDTAIPVDPKERDRRIAGIRVLNSILFSESGEFFNTLFDEGIITSEFGYFFESCASYSFIALVNDADDPETVYRRFVEYIERVKREGIPPEDFERCKRVNYAKNIRSFNSTENIAQSVLDNVFAETEIFDYVEMAKEITLSYVEELLRTMYREEYYAMSVVRPLKGRKKK